MSSPIPNALTSGDITATLRSLPRRFGALLQPIDERDPLRRKLNERGESGWTPAELARACLEDLRMIADGVERATRNSDGAPALVELPRDEVHGDRRGGEPEELLAQLGQVATDLADRIAGLDQEAFGIEVATAGGSRRLIDQLRAGIDAVAVNLRSITSALGRGD